jgi:hypothetical protein
MKMKNILGCMTVAVVFGCSVVSVRANDINPPPWARFQPNTTFQNWDFNTSANPLPPDAGAYYNPNGMPIATITGGTWLANFDQISGVWQLGASSSIDLNIPNTPFNPNNEKIVWTQITWEAINTGDPAPVVMVNGIASDPVTSYQVGNGDWMQSYYLTTLAFNPSSEDVIITGSYYVTEMVVDTICPEPSTFGLLALGGLALAAYRRRSK